MRRGGIFALMFLLMTMMTYAYGYNITQPYLAGRPACPA